MTTFTPDDRSNRLSTKALIALFDAAGKIPLPVRRCLGKCGGRVFSLFASRDRAVARLQLQAVLPDVDAHAVARDVFANIGQVFMESLNLEPLLGTGTEARVIAEQPELFEGMMGATRPVICLTAHTGNWELLGAFFNRHNPKVISIGRPARSATMHSVLVTTRSRSGINMMWRQGKSGLKELIEALIAGRLIGALIDQDTQVSSVPVPFFGIPAQTPITLIEIGKKYNALFFAVFIARETSGNFRFFTTPIDEQQSSDQILAQYSYALEKVIRTYPAQWIWFHKRWRTTPQGERLSTAQYLESFSARKSGATHG